MAGSAGFSGLRRLRTAAGLPGRVVSCEDRCDALEQRVAQRLDEMRAELGELRTLLAEKIDADTDATALVGQLLRQSEARLAALESATGSKTDGSDAR